MNHTVLFKGLLVIVILVCAFPAQAETEVFRLGMIGLDTSHVIAFTQIINNPKNNYGCRVVAGFPGGSPDMPASADRVEKFTARLRDEFGVEIVETIEQLCEKVDGVLLESVDGRPHLKQIRPVIAARKPVFVDKPVAASLADVIEIFRLAQENNVPCWSSSAFRYGQGIVGIKDNAEVGKVKSCDVFGSSSWTEHHPDLYLYGIHPVTALYAVMGTGCHEVRRFRTEGLDMVVGIWKDGRIGTFRDLRGGKSGASVRIYGTNGMIEAKSSGYKPLVDEIVRFFKTGEVPVLAQETIEIYAFMSAADISKAKGDAAVSLRELIEKTRRQNEERRLQQTRGK
ncbi:MAG: Gfo/Idh/MocA family oxidoreductase [Phycisphaerales bacterium]|nr:MAG: Gfo/Idh/MocA family oxidoreductase [Phycisphaerales bacterium]